MSLISTSNIFAQENETACPLSNLPIPEEGEVILLEDNTVYYETRGAVTAAAVDKTFAIGIQNLSGECTSSASVRITGSYLYDSGTGEVFSADLSASMSYVPLHWSVFLNDQWTTVSGSSITHSVYYQSYTDYMDCMHSGYWSSGATFAIK